MKLLVQDPTGYFISDLHPDNFAVYEGGFASTMQPLISNMTPITLGIVTEHGGRYKGFNKTSSDEVHRAGQLVGELGRSDKVAIWEYADTVQ